MQKCAASHLTSGNPSARWCTSNTNSDMDGAGKPGIGVSKILIRPHPSACCEFEDGPSKPLGISILGVLAKSAAGAASSLLALEAR